MRSPLGLGNHVDFKSKSHSGLFQVEPEIAVDHADGWEVLYAREAHVDKGIEVVVHDAERIGSADSSENRGVFDDGEDLTGHLEDYRVGITVWHQARQRSSPRHAVAARVVDNDQISATRFGELRRETDSGARSNDYFAAFDCGAEPDQCFVAGHTARSLLSGPPVSTHCE